MGICIHKCTCPQAAIATAGTEEGPFITATQQMWKLRAVRVSNLCQVRQRLGAGRSQEERRLPPAQRSPPSCGGGGEPSEAARAARQVSIPTDHPLGSAAPRSSLLGTRTRQGWFSELQTQTHVQPSTASEPQKIKTHPRFSGTAPISNIQTRKHSRPPAPDRAGFQQGPRPPPCPLRLRSRLEGEGGRTVLPTHLALG